MKKNIIVLVCISILIWGGISLAAKDMEIKGKQLVSQDPPFTLTLPSECSMIHSFSQENPEMSSLTRVYFLIREKNKQVGEMLIVQIADKTNPQAGPISAPPLLPYTGKRMYLKDKMKSGEMVINYMVQLMAWNPEAASLQPIVKKGLVIPSEWALQGQFLFDFQGDHVVYIRYSRAVDSFGLKVSDDGKNWEKESISGNEKKAYEIFLKSFTEMINSIRITTQ